MLNNNLSQAIGGGGRRNNILKFQFYCFYRKREGAIERRWKETTSCVSNIIGFRCKVFSTRPNTWKDFKFSKKCPMKQRFPSNLPQFIGQLQNFKRKWNNFHWNCLKFDEDDGQDISKKKHSLKTQIYLFFVVYRNH